MNLTSKLLKTNKRQKNTKLPLDSGAGGREALVDIFFNADFVPLW